MEKYSIANPEDITVILAKFIDPKFEISDIVNLDEISNLALRIKLDGTPWKGYVNQKIAKFICDAELQIRETLVSLGLEEYELPEQIIHLKIEEGSSELIQALTKFFEVLKGMNTKHCIFGLIAISMVLGIPNIDNIIKEWTSTEKARIQAELDKEKARIQAEVDIEKSKAELEKRKAELGMMDTVIEQNAKISTHAFQLQTPQKRLVKSMGEKDKIQFSNGEYLSKERAKKLFIKGDRSKADNYFLDAPYKIENLNTPIDGDWKVKLLWGDHGFTATLKLDTEQYKKFTEAYNTAQKEGKPVTLDLQVTASVNKNGVTKAEVVHVGSPRENAITLGVAIDISNGKSLNVVDE